MKRGWKVGLIATAAALVVVAALQFAPKDDGLDWIRKYGGSETVMMAQLNETTEVYHHSFTFKDVPLGLVREIKAWRTAHPQIRHGSLETGIISIAYRDERPSSANPVQAANEPVFVSRIIQLSWLERQWRALSVKFGWSKPPNGRFEVVRVGR